MESKNKNEGILTMIPKSELYSLQLGSPGAPVGNTLANAAFCFHLGNSQQMLAQARIYMLIPLYVKNLLNIIKLSNSQNCLNANFCVCVCVCVLRGQGED